MYIERYVCFRKTRFFAVPRSFLLPAMYLEKGEIPVCAVKMQKIFDFFVDKILEGDFDRTFQPADMS